MKHVDRLLSEYGYQRVPSHVPEVECQDCRGQFCNKVLFTQESLREPSTAEGYAAWVENIRLHSYCKTHALTRTQ